MRMQNISLGRRQRGLSKWGWLLFIGLLVMAATGALRLGPHYIDFRMVQGVLDRLPANEVHRKMSRSEITDHFKKQFRVENFRIPLKQMMKIDRTRDDTTITIDYEVREHLFYNVDVVLVFSEQRTYN